MKKEKRKELSEEEAKALFRSLLTKSRGEKMASAAISGMESRKTTFRVNTIKAEVFQVEEELKTVGFKLSPAPFYGAAFALADGKKTGGDKTGGNIDDEKRKDKAGGDKTSGEENCAKDREKGCEKVDEEKVDEENGPKAALTRTAAYENGEIYLQSFSSMLPPLVLAAGEREDVLDMTAAPGGKTTEIFALSSGKARITACEKDFKRAERLKFNLEKQGAKATVLQEDSLSLSDFLQFDRILLDAPCSGSGTILWNAPKTYRYFSEELVKNSAALQKKLLKKAGTLVKKGGVLVYSTCSLLKEEDEDAISSLLSSGDFVLEPFDLSGKDKMSLFLDERGMLGVLPTDLYEGFFVAKLRRIR